MLYLRYPGFLKKAFTMSYDDGVNADKRLVKLMADRRIKGTFNLNSGWLGHPGRLSNEEVTSIYLDSGMEVAVHGLYHLHIADLNDPEIIKEVSDDRRNLERITGRIVRGMAYAYGEYNESVISGASSCGIVYSRTVRSTHSFGLPPRWMELNPTCHHNDKALSDLWERFTAQNPDYSPALFYLWGHSYEFDNDNNWDMIESFLDKAANRDDIWYATNIEIYDYVTAWKNVVTSFDEKAVYNPTAYKLCFVDSSTGKEHELAPGEAINL